MADQIDEQSQDGAAERESGLSILLKVALLVGVPAALFAAISAFTAP